MRKLVLLTFGFAGGTVEHPLSALQFFLLQPSPSFSFFMLHRWLILTEPALVGNIPSVRPLDRMTSAFGLLQHPFNPFAPVLVSSSVCSDLRFNYFSSTRSVVVRVIIQACFHFPCFSFLLVKLLSGLRISEATRKLSKLPGVRDQTSCYVGDRCFIVIFRLHQSELRSFPS